jgi:YgiT-type zinc finger domain-containing protein
MGRCVHCRIETHFGFTTDVYTRQGLDIEVTVTGIPANVCPSCGEAYVSMDIAKEVASFVHPLFEAARQLKKLPTPKVTIDFPALVPAEPAMATLSRDAK